MASWSVAPVKNVADLGVTIDGIAAKKAHKRANLIIRCFMSRDLTSLVRAFTIYVRPIFGRPFVKWFALCYRSVVCLSCL